MQIETKLIVVKTKFSSFWGFRDKTCHEQDSGVDELSLVLLHSLKCQRPSQYKFFCQYLIETSMDLWTCCPTRLSVQRFSAQSPPVPVATLAKCVGVPGLFWCKPAVLLNHWTIFDSSRLQILWTFPPPRLLPVWKFGHPQLYVPQVHLLLPPFL